MPRIELRTALRVEPGRSFDLEAFDTGATYGRAKATADEELALGLERLADVQERIWASKGTAVLVVLQGIDTAGKDGTIRHVMNAFNPLGCRAVSFGVPTDQELAHDYLWRIHRETPGRGEITIFNRSHYEDVLVVRVNGLVSPDVWRDRYDEINAFERHLVENGTTIIKFFLLISRDEQRDRLQARIDTPEKRWKFSRGDLAVREQWDDYRDAYREVFERCSTDVAPWYVIPSDRKWFRNLAVAEILAGTLEQLHLEYPQVEEGIEAIVVP